MIICLLRTFLENALKKQNDLVEVKTINFKKLITKQFKERTKGTFVPGTSSFFEELNWN